MITVMCGLAALALSACAAPAAPSPSTAEHAETPAPGPTQALDLSCSRLIPAPVLASFGTGLVRVGIGDYTIAPPTGTFLTTARAVLANPVTPPASTTVLAALQTGYFTCTWEDAAQDLVSLSVLPDAADAYSQATVADPPLYDLAVYSGIDEGTRSFGGCSGRELESPPSPSCSLDVLAGTTWISLWTSISPSIPQSQMAAERTSLTRAARSVLAGLAEAPEYAAMPQPASRWTSVSDCRSIDSAIDHVVPGSVTSADVSSPATLDATDAYDPIFQDAILQSGDSNAAARPVSSRLSPVRPGPARSGIRTRQSLRRRHSLSRGSPVRAPCVSTGEFPRAGQRVTSTTRSSPRTGSHPWRRPRRSWERLPRRLRTDARSATRRADVSSCSSPSRCRRRARR